MAEPSRGVILLIGGILVLVAFVVLLVEKAKISTPFSRIPASHGSGNAAHKEAADELDCIEGHGLSAGMIGVVFPVEADLAVFQSAKTVVGDGDTMSVASQILEYAPGSTKGRLDVNDPFELRGCFTQGLERGRLGQIAKLAGEADLAYAKSLFER